jgi:hypothetical protein
MQIAKLVAWIYRQPWKQCMYGETPDSAFSAGMDGTDAVEVCSGAYGSGTHATLRWYKRVDIKAYNLSFRTIKLLLSTCVSLLKLAEERLD